MLTPITLILLAVSVYPLIKSFDISLRYYNLTKLGKGTPYIGFENYRFILTDPKFWQSVRVTIVFVVVSVSLVIVLSTAIALLMNREFRGRSFVRGLMLVPWAIPNVVNGLMWLWILNPSYGALNGLLTQLGII
ncbi:MAG: sugar ABC transporter permease, partial [Anaerolineaceae bacterium]